MVHEQNNSPARASHFTLFGTFLSSPSCTTTTWSFLIRPSFMEDVKTRRRIFFFFFQHGYSPNQSTSVQLSEKFAYIWVRLSKHDGVLKNENSFFFADVFTALVVVVKGLNWLVFVYLSVSLSISLRVNWRLSILFSVRFPFSPHPES